MKNLYIIDPHLISTSGHWYGYDKSIASEFEKNGWQTKIIANSFADKTVEDVDKRFEHPRGARFKYPFNILGRIANLASRYDARLQKEHYEKQLFKLLDYYSFDESDVLFFPNLHPQNGQAILNWSTTAGVKAKIVLLWRYSPKAGFLELNQKAYRDVFARSKNISNIHHVSDSELLVDQYKQLGADKVTVLPIPHTHHFTEKKQNDKITFGYLGIAGWHKGFGLLSRFFAEINEPLAYGLVQVSMNSNLNFYHRYRLRKIANEIDLPNVELLHGGISFDEYYDALNKIDVMLLAYNTEINDYTATSGVFTEALAAGIPVIVTKGTWMAAQLKKYGAGIEIDNCNADELISAAKDILNNYKEYADKATASKQAWVKFHSKETFFENFISLLKRED